MPSRAHANLVLASRQIGLVLLALAALAAMSIPAGCARPEARTLATLPPAVFAEPPTDWPATAPDVPRPVADVEAGWRNHYLPERAWRWIVVHHSSNLGGNAAKFDLFHRAPPRNWDELGYDFVIGNGTDSRDGQVEVGPRWIKQKHGAHCATPSHQFNDYGVGICLVGNFQLDNSRPSPAQWASLIALCRFLCREYEIPPDHILGHRDAQATEGEVTTDCPGKNLDLAALHRELAKDK